MERTCLKCGAVNPHARGFVTDACPACDAIYAKVEAARKFHPETAKADAAHVRKQPPGQRSLLALAGVALAAIVVAQIAIRPNIDEIERPHARRTTPPSAPLGRPVESQPRVATVATTVPRRAIDDRLRVQGPNRIGCSSRDDYSQLSSLASSGDTEAFKAAYTIAILSGICTRFEPGEELYLEDTAVFAGLIQVRKRGELGRYWTASETAR